MLFARFLAWNYVIINLLYTKETDGGYSGK